MSCICCGSRVAGNVSHDRCLRCYQAHLGWWDTRNWIPLAAERIANLEAERDLFRREVVALAKDAIDQEREKARRLESAVKAAIPSVDDYTRGRALIGGGTAEHHAKVALRMLREALLSGRGEGDPVADRAAALNRQWQKQIDIRRGEQPLPAPPSEGEGK